jgi:hypothetical protein
MGQRLAQAHLMPYTGLQYGVLRLRTFAEQLSCSLKLLGFVPMHSDSQQFVRVASWFETFTRKWVALSRRALKRFQSNVASGGDFLMNDSAALLLYRAACSWSTKSIRSAWPRTFRPSPQDS